MKTLDSVTKLCTCCMEEHAVYTVEVKEKNVFKGKEVEYAAVYEYCEHADEYMENENLISSNDIAMKNAYREQNQLLTSEEIVNIRKKYCMSQKDMACLLGWGEKTITRYEGHQVQDIAHDSVLRKINDDPQWFLELLEKGKEKIPQAAYVRYKEEISRVYEMMKEDYLKKSILAQYVKYQNDSSATGNSALDFGKIVDTVTYFANSAKVIDLYKVKLMKLLWYADCLSFKKYNHAITGLVYQAMPMGALPVAHKSIVDLRGIQYEEIEFDNGTGTKFMPVENAEYETLTLKDKGVLDKVIDVFGDASRQQIAEVMHRELAYIKTKRGQVIDFAYAKDLSIE